PPIEKQYTSTPPATSHSSRSGSENKPSDPIQHHIISSCAGSVVSEQRNNKASTLERDMRIHRKMDSRYIEDRDVDTLPRDLIRNLHDRNKETLPVVPEPVAVVQN